MLSTLSSLEFREFKIPVYLPRSVSEKHNRVISYCLGGYTYYMGVKFCGRSRTEMWVQGENGIIRCSKN